MSDIVLLGIGFAVFFLCVYGVVMISGLKLAKKRIEEQPEFRESLDDDELDGLPTNVEY